MVQKNKRHREPNGNDPLRQVNQRVKGSRFFILDETSQENNNVEAISNEISEPSSIPKHTVRVVAANKSTSRFPFLYGGMQIKA